MRNYARFVVFFGCLNGIACTQSTPAAGHEQTDMSPAVHELFDQTAEVTVQALNQSGDPVSGVRISLVGRDDIFTTSDGMARFSFTAQQFDSLPIHATAPQGFQPQVKLEGHTRALTSQGSPGLHFKVKVHLKGPTAPVATPNAQAGSHSLSTPEAAVRSVKKSSALPPSSRVFAVDLDGDGNDEILGSQANALWAYRFSGGEWKAMWSIRSGQGGVHRVVAGSWDGRRRVFAVWGVARGALRAPLVLAELDPMNGAMTELWRHNGPRNEPAHLSLSDVDRDGVLELALAYYQDKYHVVTRHMEVDGRVHMTSEPIRMATARVYGDVTGDGSVDEVISRVYGDAKGEPGDIMVNTGAGYSKISTQNGVRGVLVAQVGDSPLSIYFADGWVSDYGRSARAQLRRVSLVDSDRTIETIGKSIDEFTFFELWARDLDGDQQPEIIARGNKHLTIFSRKDGRWLQKTAASFEPVINVAFGRATDGVWRIFVPNDKGTRVSTMNLGMGKAP